MSDIVEIDGCKYEKVFDDDSCVNCAFVVDSELCYENSVVCHDEVIYYKKLENEMSNEYQKLVESGFDAGIEAFKKGIKKPILSDRADSYWNNFNRGWMVAYHESIEPPIEVYANIYCSEPDVHSYFNKDLMTDLDVSIFCYESKNDAVDRIMKNGRTFKLVEIQ